jgi:phage gp45-like
VRDLVARALHMFGRGRLTVVDDTGSIQKVQVETAELDQAGATSIIDGVRVLLPYGVASNPPLGSETLLARLFGNPGMGIALGAHHPASRKKDLSPGDSALYDLRGAYVWLTPQGLVVDGAGLPATIRNVGALTIDGDLHVTGEIIRGFGGGDQVQLGTHTHGQVQPGSGVSGAPEPG